MRDLQARLVDRLRAEDEQVEIDRARAEPRPQAPFAAQAPLDREQPLEQLTRAQRRLDGRRAVEETRLVRITDGIGQAQRRDCEHLDPLLLAQQLDSGPDLRLPVAQVAAEPDECPGHDADSAATVSASCAASPRS